MSNINSKKNILLIGGHDPTGGAGIQADIESVSAAGCRPLTIVTALTAQNTRQVIKIIPQSVDNLQQQLSLLMDDYPVHAVKTGLLGSIEQFDLLASLFSSIKIPIVIDPVLKSGSGDNFLAKEIHTRYSSLLPFATLITPNHFEAKQLGDCDIVEDAAERLITIGSKNVLITGADEKTENVKNILFTSDKTLTFEYPRLPHVYHGSGCTLASHIAAKLAMNETIEDAIKLAQDYTWQCLNNAESIGRSQWHPNRFYKYDHE